MSPVQEMTAASELHEAPDWLTQLWPGEPVAVARLRWGFTNESWAVTLADGSRLAVTRVADPITEETAARSLVVLRPRLVAAGLPLAMPVAGSGARRWPSDIRVSELIEGVVGASLLDDPGGGQLVGRLCGLAGRRIAAVDPSNAGLPDLWATGRRLAEAARSWADAVAADLELTERADLADAIAVLPDRLAGRPVVLVHGDLVPVNIVVRDGRLVGVLDLETLRLADPLYDVAWFRHILGFHHPDVLDAASDGFVEAAGSDPLNAAHLALMALLPVIRILEILAALSADDPRRAAWLRQLRAALGRPR